MTAIEILIPCSAFHLGKSRLAGSLGRAERALLCRALLATTVRRARRLAERVFVVSGDAAALAEAARLGAAGFDDGGTDLNGSIALANAKMADGGVAQRRLAILPVDLPFATPSALQKALLRSADMVIAPDRVGDGTNLLVLSPAIRTDFRFDFGPGSFRRHLGTARVLGCEPVVHKDARIAFDLDSPADLELWRLRAAQMSRRLSP